MDNSITRLNIRFYYFGFVDFYTMFIVNGDGLTIDSLDMGTALEFFCICRHYLARDNVVGQNCSEGRLVFGL